MQVTQQHDTMTVSSEIGRVNGDTIYVNNTNDGLKYCKLRSRNHENTSKAPGTTTGHWECYRSLFLVLEIHVNLLMLSNKISLWVILSAVKN